MFQENRDDTRERAKTEILKLQEENRTNFNKHRVEAKQYNVDDFVAIKRTQFTPGSKFLHRFLGPYRIKRVLRNNQDSRVWCRIIGYQVVSNSMHVRYACVRCHVNDDRQFLYVPVKK